MESFGTRNVIRALRVYEAQHPFSGVAFGELFNLSTQELCKIDADYKEKRYIYRLKIDEKKRDLNRKVENSNYMDSLELDQGKYSIYFIDDSTKLMFALKKLEEADKVALNVETIKSEYDFPSLLNYRNHLIIFRVVIMQMAVKDCVILLDISTLKQKVNEEYIKMFFEVFFDPNLKRIGFDIKSNWNSLRQTFKWMPNYLQTRQPKAYCISTFIGIVSLFLLRTFPRTLVNLHFLGYRGA